MVEVSGKPNHPLGTHENSSSNYLLVSSSLVELYLSVVV